MKQWEYAIAVEEAANWWTLWFQDESDVPEPEARRDNFRSDTAMLGYMSREGWELATDIRLWCRDAIDQLDATDIRLHDGLPRLIFKRRL